MRGSSSARTALGRFIGTCLARPLTNGDWQLATPERTGALRGVRGATQQDLILLTTSPAFITANRL